MVAEATGWQRLMARAAVAWAKSCTYWAHQTRSKRLYGWAIAAYTRALVYAPNWQEPRLRRAILKGRELDDYAGAVRDLTTIIEQEPQWAEPYLQRGLLHSFHGLHAAQQAIADLEQFILLAPQHGWRDEAERLLLRLSTELNERGWIVPSDPADEPYIETGM